jgi:hypothetical protein
METLTFYSGRLRRQFRALWASGSVDFRRIVGASFVQPPADPRIRDWAWSTDPTPRPVTRGSLGCELAPDCIRWKRSADCAAVDDTLVSSAPQLVPSACRSSWHRTLLPVVVYHFWCVSKEKRVTRLSYRSQRYSASARIDR